MKLAFISDVHSNLEALESCLAVIDREALTRLCVLAIPWVMAPARTSASSLSAPAPGYRWPES
jgi:hypothetical protein